MEDILDVLMLQNIPKSVMIKMYSETIIVFYLVCGS